MNGVRFAIATSCMIAGISAPLNGGAADPDRMLFLSMKPAVADALEQKFVAGSVEADEAMTRLDGLIRGRTVTLNGELAFDHISPERKWISDREKSKELEIMPGWSEVTGTEMTHIFKTGQILDFFAKRTLFDKKETVLKELKAESPSANGHFVYGRWDKHREESEVFLSRAQGAPMDSLLMVKIQQFRFRTGDERDDFLNKVQAADEAQKEKAAAYLAGKAEFVQAVSVVTAKDQPVRLSDRRPVAYEIGDEVYDSRDGGVRCDLSFETENDEKKLNIFYLDAGLTGKKKEHDTGEKIPEFYSGHYTEKIDYSKDSMFFAILFHSHLDTADVLVVRLMLLKP